MSGVPPGGASDEAFVPFAFVIVTFVAIGLFSAPMWRFCARVISFLKSGGSAARSKPKPNAVDEDDARAAAARAAAAEENPFIGVLDYILYFPRQIIFVATHIGPISVFASLLLANRAAARHVCWPRFLRFTLRVRPVVLVLWVVLFVTMMYTSLTFDAYKALDLPADASLADVKRSYRVLSKKLHPDKDPSPAARVRYALVRKAYKSLVDRDSFEADAMQELSAGVALPIFLTSRENETWVFFGILALLIGTPIWLYKKFSGTNDEKIERLTIRVQQLEGMLEPLYAELGVPEDSKFALLKKHRARLEAILRQYGLFPSNPFGFEQYPPLPEFAKRCLEPEKFGPFFASMRMPLEVIRALQQHFTTDKSYLDNSLPSDVAGGSPTSSGAPSLRSCVKTALIPRDKFDATMYLFQIVASECDQAAREFDEAVHGRVKCLQKLQQHHANMMEKLTMVHQDKAAARDLDAVIEGPSVGFELSHDIATQLMQVIQKMQKDYYQQQQQPNVAVRGQRQPRMQAQQQHGGHGHAH